MDRLIESLGGGCASVLFGAGLSVNSGLPLVRSTAVAPGLVETILDGLGVEAGERDLLLDSRLPFEAFVQNLTLGADIAPLLDVFALGEPNHAHRFLASLAGAGLVRNFLTTNFDCLLERALTERAIAHRVFSSERDFAAIDPAGSTVNVIKLHGCVTDKDALGITIRNVAERRESQPFASMLARYFAAGPGSHVVVLGYSGSDHFDITPIIEGMSYGEALSTVSYVAHRGGLVADRVRSDAPLPRPFQGFPGRAIEADADALLDVLAARLGVGPEPRTALPPLWQDHVAQWLATGVALPEAALGGLFAATSQFNLSDRYFRRAIAKANSEETRRVLMANMIPGLAALERYDEVEELTRRLSADSTSAESPALLAQTALNEALAYAHQNCHQEALVALDNAQALRARMALPRPEPFDARLAANRASCLVALRSGLEARDALEEAERLTRQTGDIEGQSIVARAHAQLHRENGDYEVAADWAGKAAGLLGRLGLAHLEGAALLDQADNLRDAGNLEMAREPAAEALRLAGTIEDPRLASYANARLAHIAADLGDLEAAERYMREAMASDGGDEGLRQAVSMAVILQRDGRLQQANEMLREVLSSLSERSDRSAMELTRYASLNLANVCLRLHDFGAAVAAARDARDLADALGDDAGGYRARVNLGMALCESGEVSDGMAELRAGYELAASLLRPGHQDLDRIEGLIGDYESVVVTSQYAYPSTRDERGPIIDRMRELSIGMVFRLDECCRTCRFHQLRNNDYGFCTHHGVELLRHFGDNPYGFDDRVCSAFEHVEPGKTRTRPCIVVSARLSEDGETDYQLGEGYLLRAMAEGNLEIRSGGDDGQRIAGIDEYMLMFVELDLQGTSVVLTYTNRKVHVPLPS